MSVQDSPETQLTLDDMQEFFALTLEMLCIAGYDGYFKRLNPTWSRVLGYTNEELMAEPFLHFVHPDDRAATIAIAQVAMQGSDVFSFKNRYRCKDGSYRLLEWTTAPSPKRQLLCAIARDVTDREREQQRLSHLINASRTVLYSLSVGPNGPTGCTFISENVAAQLGYTASEFIGAGTRAWGESLHPDDRGAVFSSHDNLVRAGQDELRYRARHKDGTYRWVHDERRLVRDAAGNPVEILGTWRDVSDWVRAEELIRTQAAALSELSTPLIPISDQVVVMPLIGTMDSERSKQVLDTLLHGVQNTRASIAILDITGVSVVDTQVANGLLQAAKAVRLLGAEVVLTGIRPDVARTLVSLGVDLSDIVTRGTLQAGIGYAMASGKRAPA